MLPSLLITFREGLEAALIVGIILGTLDQLDQAGRRWVWVAVGAAAALCLALAAGLEAAGAELEGKAEAVFEGTAMLLAVTILTWMIFWMRRQARSFRAALQADVRQAAHSGRTWALFSVVFLAVFREGVEMALFLTALNLANGGGRSTFIGGLLGLSGAILVGWMIYTSAVRLNVRRFFDVTSLLLLVFAAGLFAHGLYEFQAVGWLPALAGHVWNLRPVLDDQSTAGSLLRVLVGYSDSPSLLEVLGYLGYWGVALAAANGWLSRRTVSARV